MEKIISFVLFSQGIIPTLLSAKTLILVKVVINLSYLQTYSDSSHSLEVIGKQCFHLIFLRIYTHLGGNDQLVSVPVSNFLLESNKKKSECMEDLLHAIFLSFSHHSDERKRKEACAWLEKFQQSENAWCTCISALTTSHEMDVLLFCSQSLNFKLRHLKYKLSEVERENIWRDLQKLTSLYENNFRVLSQLSLSVVRLF